MKYLFLIIIFIVASCNSGAPCETNANNECISFDSCNKMDDCGEDYYCNKLRKECHPNPCLGNIFCGTGTCVPGDDLETDNREYYHCQCDENSLPYDYFEDSSHPLICTPKCQNHSDCSEAYINLGHQVAGACIKGQCNERNICEENSDCPETDICGHGICDVKPTGE